jgi:polysaccharide chain length determinant protein (PEP-CTERM system associated)
LSEETGNYEQILARVLRLVRRRWWIVLGVACTVTVIGIVALLQIPNRYTSEATLVVVRQQVPERYVVPNSNTDLSAALQAMKREVLSRGQLRKIIEDFQLYPKQRKRGVPLDAMVERMLGDIDIQPLDESQSRRDFNAFRISYLGDTPQRTQAVASTLTSLFTNEYLRSRGEQATNTTRFLHEQVEAKKKKLEEQEQLLRDFKMQHMGELPEQQAGNLGILSGLQSQLQSTMAGLSRAEEQRVYLESLLNAYRQSAAASEGGAVNPLQSGLGMPRPPTPFEAAQNDLAKLHATRSSLLSRGYTLEHPDLKKLDRDIAQVQDTVRTLKPVPRPVEAEDAPAGRPKNAVRPVTGGAGTDPAVAQLRSQLDARRVEIENLSREERRLKGVIAGYESRLNNTPVREAQQAGIVRNTEALRQEYADLQKKEQESQLATNLEKEQGGQQFRLVDPPVLPSKPSSPKRFKLSLAAVAGGLFLGIALALFLELRDTSFYSEKELSGFLEPPFVVGIPALPTRAETQGQRRALVLQAIAGSVMASIIALSELYIYKRG